MVEMDPPRPLKTFSAAPSLPAEPSDPSAPSSGVTLLGSNFSPLNLAILSSLLKYSPFSFSPSTLEEKSLSSAVPFFIS